MGFGAKRGLVPWTPGFSRTANLLPNPGFEDNNHDGWDSTGPTTLSIVTNVHSGHYAFEVRNALANGAQRAAFYDLPNPGLYSGRAVTLSGWIRDYIEPGGAGARLQLTDSAGSTVSTTVQGTTYEEVSVTRTFPAGNTVFRIFVTSLGPGGGAVNWCRADDLVVTAV